MGTKIDNLKRMVGIEPGGKWKVKSKESKRDQSKLHWSDKSPKYRVRYIGVHNPAKGVVYRKVRVKRSTFQDTAWKKKNPQIYKSFMGPIGKKPPLDIYNSASMSKKQIKAIQSKPSYKKRYSWQ